MKTTVYKLPFYYALSDIFSLYAKAPMAVFLDSSLQNHLGRYSVIGLNPYLTLEDRDGILYQNGEKKEESFEEALGRYLKENQEEHSWDLPLIAGAIGYFSYDYGRKFEQIATRHPKEISIPDARFVFYDNLILEDKERRFLYLTARGQLCDPAVSIAQICSQIRNCPHLEAPAKGCGLEEFAANFEKEEYKQAIDRMIRYIVDGDIYIANMTQQLTIDSRKEPYQVFRYLRTHNPSPFGGYFHYPDFQIISASPERFLRMKNRRIETRPIKGTRPRGKTPWQDQAFRRELEESSKDKSELLMIVDLERNDLNRVCVPGSVNVTEHFAVEEYATVFHLVSTIVGELRPKLTAIDLIRASFPGGSITGAPKIRAMEIIDQLEHSRRNLYTGSMGYLSLDGSCDLNIVIRTALYQRGRYHLGAGGGITCESQPEFEYEETLQKARAILEAIREA